MNLKGNIAFRQLRLEPLCLDREVVGDHEHDNHQCAEPYFIQFFNRGMLHKRALRLNQQYPSYCGDDPDGEKRTEGELLFLQKPYHRPEKFKDYERKEDIIDKGDNGITRRVQYMKERVIEYEAAGNKEQERGDDMEQDIKIQQELSKA